MRSARIFTVSFSGIKTSSGTTIATAMSRSIKVAVSQEAFDAVKRMPKFKALPSIQVFEYDAANGVATVSISKNANSRLLAVVEHLLHNPTSGETTINVDTPILTKVKRHQDGLHTLLAKLDLNGVLRFTHSDLTVYQTHDDQRAKIVSMILELVSTLNANPTIRVQDWLRDQGDRIL